MEVVKQFFKYSLVGGINTIVCLGFILFGMTMGWGYIIYTLIGYSFSFIVSFILNFKITFNIKKNEKIKKRFFVFLLINSINLVFIQFIQLLLIEEFLLVEIYAVLIGMACYTSFGFYLNRKFVFNL